MQLNPVDFLLVALVLLGAWSGWRHGFLFAALDLLSLVASLVAAFLGYRQAGELLAELLPRLGVWVAPLSFVILFLIVHLVLVTLVGRLLLPLPQRVHGNALNRLLGIAPGLVNGGMYAAVAAVLMLMLPLGAHIGQWVNTSAFAPRMAGPAEWVEAKLAPIFAPAVQRTLQALMVQPESRQSIPLRFRVTHARARPDLEAEMLTLVNAERRTAGLKPVKPDPELTRVARAHSRDMFERGYFSHFSPEGRNLGDRLQHARIGYLSAGENLALAPTLNTAHTGLMHSPGHRANVLRPQFGRLGIGILDGGRHGLMVTQAFRN
jgi:uncharacterized protein YkwD